MINRISNLINFFSVLFLAVFFNFLLTDSALAARTCPTTPNPQFGYTCPTGSWWSNMNAASPSACQPEKTCDPDPVGGVISLNCNNNNCDLNCTLPYVKCNGVCQNYPYPGVTDPNCNSYNNCTNPRSCNGCVAGYTLDVNGICTGTALKLNFDSVLTDRLKNSTNAASAITVLPTGFVGIGTSTPDTLLKVVGSGQVINVSGGRIGGLDLTPLNSDEAVPLGYLQSNYVPSSGSFWSGSLAGNIYNANTGNVGIGTASPGAKLDLQNLTSSTTPALSLLGGGTYGSGYHVSWGNYSKLSQNSSGVNFITWGAYNNGASWTRSYNGGVTGLVNLAIGNGNYFSIQTDSQASPNAPSWTDVLTVNGTQVGIGTVGPAAKLDVYRNDASYAVNIGDANNRAVLKLRASNAGTEQLTVSRGVNVMQLQSVGTNGSTAYDISLNPFGGNVGIGNVSPGGTLDVSFSQVGELASKGLRVMNQSGQNNDIAPIYFGVLTAQTQRVKAAIGLKRLSSWGAGDLIFAVDSNADDASVNFSSDTKMVIQQDGNVGIGSTSPAYKLSVVGSGITLDGNTGNANIMINDIANRNASIKFNSAGTTQWTIGRGDSDELLPSSFFIGTGSTGGASSKLVIDNSGRVGISTTTPNNRLSIVPDGGSSSDTINVFGGSIGGLDLTPLTNDQAVPLGYLKNNYLDKNSSGIATFVGTSTNAYTGNNTGTGGGTKGYAAANAICNASHTGSHVCTSFEVLFSIASGKSMPTNENVWIFAGPPGYTASANDCEGRTSAAYASLGAYWEKPTTDYPNGRGLLGHCDVGGIGIRFACCK